MLEAKNIDFNYKEKRIFNNLNIILESKIPIGLVGSNGSGKSTLLRLLCGILSPQNGEIFLYGKKINFNNVNSLLYLKKHVGYIFQNPENQIVGVTVEEDIAFGLENLGLDRNEIKKRINWALNVTDLIGLEKKDPNTLSGGQKQRLAIASMIAMQPDFILMDEPTTMLDPEGREEIYKVIKNLINIGKTIIIASHHAKDLRFVEKIIALDSGKIMFYDQRKKFYNWSENKRFNVEIPFENIVKKYTGKSLKELERNICL
ncbi:energy-coupling factor transport system ATP-binding protein [Marinitoga hydrogenitolerans DSM 16785]|uniref:Energy-coupling factor transport system ATP-binding protein n=1 Tax=Marinitoga hydrogenitolerans (strain DSM 16785 / JCM 12826 / AT1271) TaxID=1122195 RepID=A0A1M4TZF4_MARH1|nr:ABC transporter ATP-binding protein [Marinitoga hydrogenitolerans]SHE49829.1 energy-coupling factor transport system ATP-binding protein [Marinitoga hydrogenitolerans DSM 16785]